MRRKRKQDTQVSKRPANVAFKQQRLAAWQPILTPQTVLPVLFIIGLVFVPLGAVFLVASNSVSTVSSSPLRFIFFPAPWLVCFPLMRVACLLMASVEGMTGGLTRLMSSAQANCGSTAEGATSKRNLFSCLHTSTSPSLSFSLSR